MGVFTFVCKSDGEEWSGKQYSGDLEAAAASTFELQRKLVQAAAATDSSGGVQSSFSFISPSSAVFQMVELPRKMRCYLPGFLVKMADDNVIIGGGGGGGAIISGGGGATAAPAGGAPAAEAALAEEKKEEKEESDDDMGFSLFD